MHRGIVGIAICGLLAGCVDPGGLRFPSAGGNVGPATPVNLPPDDYDGEFWNDRRGCTFIRSETNSWVPRVDQRGRPMCDPANGYDLPDPDAPRLNAPSYQPRVFTDPETGIVYRTLPPEPIPPSYVEVATFRDADRALKARAQFAALGFPIVGGDKPIPAGRAHTLVLGPFTVKSALEDGLLTAQREGYDGVTTYSN